MRFRDINDLNELLKNSNLAKTISIIAQKLDTRRQTVYEIMFNALSSCHEIEMEELYSYFKLKLRFPLRPVYAIESHFAGCIDCRKRYSKEAELFRRNPKAYFAMIEGLYCIKK